MQKQNDHSYRFDYGVPLLVSILVGVLFFGAYLAVGWLYPEPPRGIIWIFVAAYLVFSAVIYGVYLFRQYKKRTEQVMHLTLNDKMHNLFKYTVALPYAIVDDQGRVRVVNDAMQHLIGAEDPFYRGNISDLCGGVTLADMIEAERYRPPDHLSTEAQIVWGAQGHRGRPHPAAEPCLTPSPTGQQTG